MCTEHRAQPPADAVDRETDLHCLLYCSVATEAMSVAALETLLEQSRRNNRRNGVTGLLLYRDGTFMQALEGERSTIQRLLETLRQDPRHAAIDVCLDGPIKRRSFDAWAMAFRNLGEMDLEATRSLLNIAHGESTDDESWRLTSLMRSFLAIS